jgi:hypothetical protein
MSTTQPSDEQVVEAMYMFAAEQMKSGVAPHTITSMLVDKGLDRETAGVVVSNLTRMRSQARRDGATKNMIFGALWCVGGIVVTAVTYSAAMNGGTYVVAWGAIVFGAIQFFRGLAGAMGD